MTASGTAGPPRISRNTLGDYSFLYPWLTAERGQHAGTAEGSWFESQTLSHFIFPCVFNDLQRRVFFSFELRPSASRQFLRTDDHQGRAG